MLIWSIIQLVSIALQAPPTIAEARLEAHARRLELQAKSPLQNLTFRSVGPSNMGGRVVDVIGFAAYPEIFYAAYASGGLWRSDDRGNTWRPLFEQMPSITIGAIAARPNNPDEIWVGTGEANSSRSSYAGTGVFYSQDGGVHWQHMGLADSHHISRIQLHPTETETLYVAAMGHLYSPNRERGIFKSTDGGKSWKQTLYINDSTGASDLLIDPADPSRLYAGTWQRERRAWNFTESGPESGLYLSEDGGERWFRVTSGLPTGDFVGRIGFGACLAKPQTLYISLDNQSNNPSPLPDGRALTGEKLIQMTKEQLLALDDQVIEDFLEDQDLAPEWNAKKLRQGFEKGELQVSDLIYHLFGDNQEQLPREIRSTELYRSDDRGRTWRRTHSEPIPEFTFNFGYYFGGVAVDPVDPETVFVFGVALLKSTDGGKSFINAMTPDVHVDHHALWIDPKAPHHMVLGNDGGLYRSGDGGRNWRDWNWQNVGQFYTVAYDMAKPYRIYGGLQDNGVWRGPNSEQKNAKPWTFISGGDGASVQVDFRDNETVYAGKQFGYYSRKNMANGDSLAIHPRHQLKQEPYRYNWITPLVLSRHQQDILYMGSQKLLRSLDKGANWQEISPDLCGKLEQRGDVPFGTITVIAESPQRFGKLYAGTDHGRLWTSEGGEWRRIDEGLSAGLWISSIEASPHAEGTIFVTQTGYRNDDFESYVYMTEDDGKTWKSLKSNISYEPCNVIRQDLLQADKLYLGTDVGLWLSLDRGASWSPLQSGLPHVPVYALQIHPREQELIVATHGRSIFVLDLKPLHHLDPTLLERDLLAFAPEKQTFSREWGTRPWPWDVSGAKADAVDVWYWQKQADRTEVSIWRDKQLIRRISFLGEAGLNRFDWDFRVTPEPAKNKRKKKGDEPEWHIGQSTEPYATPGRYKIRIEVGKSSTETELEITAPE